MIAGRVRLDYPHDPRMRVCAETLYTWISLPSQRWRGLTHYLPLGHKTRRTRAGRRVHRHTMKYRIPIHSRPPEIDERSEFGHWEIDSIIGNNHSGAIHTATERTSRYIAARLLPDTSAKATLDAEKDWISQLPIHAVRSLTADNGHEFAYHYQLADTTAIPTYFADPYSAWQRGTNERFNREIRRYLPKGTRFNTLTTSELDDIITEINNKPRKCLHWHTPAETLHHQIQSNQTPTVALQTRT
ncbi:MAG: IS30 family transposase [Actinomycetaceae bacterium]|nr:IS30 family transposase [Actinomycetaceae bacterium]MDY6083316.1 IS30 family transposase [Actinomycetaceae bacterium]